MLNIKLHLFLWFYGLAGLATGGPSANVVGLPMGPDLRMEPYFMEGQAEHRNLTLFTGQTAYLTCSVRNLGAKKVSWIRHQDVQILAVGDHTFTTDSRYLALHQEDQGKFTLVIKRVQMKDTGTYECQISTKPTRSLFISLYIDSPSIEILSEPALHVEQNSPLNLTCMMSTASMDEEGLPWPKLFWYKDQKLIDNYVGGRGLITESAYVRHGDAAQWTQSHLLVSKATMKDSGNYTCSSSATANSVTIKVHVLVDGESPNAWKTNSVCPHHRYPVASIWSWLGFWWMILLTKIAR